MISSVKHIVSSFASSYFRRFSQLPIIKNSTLKPLLFTFSPKEQCNIEVLDDKARLEAAQRIKIGIYFATWWTLNVVYNIYNKKVLNAFPYPWLISTLSLACGSLMMLVSWVTRIAEAPKTDFEFWKTLFPSGEPAFSVLVSRVLLSETFPVSVYLSLLPIIGGCALTAATELNFNMIGFMGAMISNLAFVFRNIFSKKGMKGKSVSGMNYYACLSIMSLFILTPFAIVVEGPQMWSIGWQTALAQIGPNFVWWVAAQSIFYHLYNQVSYMSLDRISPLTFSIGNTMKRIFVIVSSIIIFRTPIQPINAIGAAIAILGTFLYSQREEIEIGLILISSFEGLDQKFDLLHQRRKSISIFSFDKEDCSFILVDD
ncbi:hypothetical protein Dsin_027884 [Dipteronia sinensis]|uniref:Sugar phosphate transporter domain-containing protein n=1 Tax=Dipteronia sinensis TaxID=43782 RepID=A0AAD9ZPA7_9ROSI|nr:hypothetical protein Dsin_027884 [Dipteronia sinensis]